MKPQVTNYIQFYILHRSNIFANYIHQAVSETFDRSRRGNEGNARAFKREIYRPPPRFKQFAGTKREARSRKSIFINHVIPRIWKFRPRDDLNAFTCPNFRWQSAVHAHGCSQFVGIYFCRALSLRRPRML